MLQCISQNTAGDVPNFIVLFHGSGQSTWLLVPLNRHRQSKNIFTPQMTSRLRPASLPQTVCLHDMPLAGAYDIRMGISHVQYGQQRVPGATLWTRVAFTSVQSSNRQSFIPPIVQSCLVLICDIFDIVTNLTSNAYGLMIARVTRQARLSTCMIRADYTS